MSAYAPDRYEGTPSPSRAMRVVERIGSAAEVNPDRSATEIRNRVPTNGFVSLYVDVAGVSTETARWDRYVGNFARWRGLTSVTYLYGDVSVSINGAAGFVQFEALTYINLLPSATNGAMFKRVQSEKVTTSDATATTLDTVTVTDNRTWLVTCRVHADETGGGGDSASYFLALAVKRNGGAATIVGAVQNLMAPQEDAGAAGWSATMDVSGNDVRVRVTGAVGDTVVWTCITEITGEA